MTDRNTDIRDAVEALRTALTKSAASDGHRAEVLSHLEDLVSHINYIDAIRYEPLIEIPLYYCAHCGSQDVQGMNWVDVQTSRVIDEVADGEDSYFCNACEKHSKRLHEDCADERVLHVENGHAESGGNEQAVAMMVFLETHKSILSVVDMRAIADLLPPDDDGNPSGGAVQIDCNGLHLKITRIA